MDDAWVPDTSGAALEDRGLFPDLEAFAYLNHAAISPPSTEVRRAVQAVLDTYARRGVGAFGAWRAQRERLRARLAGLVGAAPEDLALVSSTTRSVVDVALCFPWVPGDRVLCLRGEFPTNVTPWQRAAETFDLELTFLDVADFATDEGLAKLDAELDRGLRLVAVSAVEFQTGLRMPVEAIAARCRDAGAQVFVDAIQAVGVVPVDVARWGVDYLGCGSHKWLMGLEGAGFLYVKPGRAEALVPRVAGWLSHEDPLTFLFEGPGHLRYDRPIRPEPTFLESGAMNGAGFAALEASVAQIEALGTEAIFAHVQRYHDALEPALRDRGFASERSEDPSRRSGILALRPPDGVDLGALVRALGERGVACTMPDGRLRFAPHWPNALAEVPRVIEALDGALAEARA
ncbi:MAG TPA: aminotransferase class V-fold PLP-dependent enzyme [Sandaracinaceae bacterium LLY-WYZ-13_1]|nr:aminotransferase class V-fold PLP-dependent enzyme [Sandaracinaceae bacterium LLY-WYZ-13_1]